MSPPLRFPRTWLMPWRVVRERDVERETVASLRRYIERGREVHELELRRAKQVFARDCDGRCDVATRQAEVAATAHRVELEEGWGRARSLKAETIRCHAAVRRLKVAVAEFEADTGPPTPPT